MGFSTDLVLQVQDRGQGQEQGGERRNPFGGLIDGAKGLLGKAKDEIQKIDKDDIGRGVGQAGRTLGQQADRMGAGQIGQQARDLGGSAERTIRGQGTDQDRQRLIEAGINAGKLAIGGPSLGLAEGVLKQTGIPGLGDLGGLFKRGAREVTKLDTLGFCKAVRENFDKLDTDHDGHISKADLTKVAEDRVFTLRNAHMMSVLNDKMEQMSNCQNDEIGSENDGVTIADIAALEKAKMEGTGFRGVAATLDGAWDAKYPALAGGGLTAYLNMGKGTGKLFSRSGLVTAGIFSVGGIYGAIDYYGSRKENIEHMIAELK